MTLQIKTKKLIPKKPSAKKKMEAKYLAKRNQIWQPLGNGNISEGTRIFWEQKVKKGFVNIPRVMPLILKIMDYLSAYSHPK